MCRRDTDWVTHLSASVLLVVMAGGCDNTNVSPMGARGPAYTLWGAFDPTSDLQVIRVVPISDTLRIQSGQPLDVTVHSTNLDTGIETSWRDSLVTFSFASETSARVHVAHFRPAFGSRHELRVVPATGEALRVYIPVPPGHPPVLDRAIRFFGPLYTISWPGAGQLNVVTLTYRIQNAACGVDEFTYNFFGESGPTETGWTLSFNLGQGSPIELDFTPINPDRPMAFPLVELRIDTEVASETWRMDSLLAANPTALQGADVFTNVENGYGFVGASYKTSLAWVPTEEELAPDTTFFPIRPGAPRCGPINAIPPRAPF